MPKIVFIEHNGTEHPVEANTGTSIMQAAVENSVPGLIGDCGGCCSCATCHGYVDPAWLGKLRPPSAEEAMMLEGALEVLDNSRLTCQISMSADLDGIVVRLPASQT
jgi:2Fe-2S ferredoxin